MKRSRLISIGSCSAALFCVPAVAAAQPATGGKPAWTLEREIVLQDIGNGPYTDHLAVDLARNRVFSTMQASNEVAVSDFHNGEVVNLIKDIKNPHGIYFSQKDNKLFVGDGGTGNINVYDGSDYHLITAINLGKGVDDIAADESRGLLYASSGGEHADSDYALLTPIDIKTLATGKPVKVPTDSLEGVKFDEKANRAFAAMSKQHSIAYIDLNTGETLGIWQLTDCQLSMPLAFDKVSNRLYVGCRNTSTRGVIDVVDTVTGKEVTHLPAGGWIDNIWYDPSRKRVFASSGVGIINTYQYMPDGIYTPLPDIDTAVMAKTSFFSPEKDRLFVAVPHLGYDFETAKVLVLKPN